MQAIPVLKVVHPEIEGEWMLINESDFDPDVHELWKPKEKKAKEPPKEEKKQQEEPPK
jgi:hypothetical protein